VQFLEFLRRDYRRARKLHLLHFLPPYSPDDNPIERPWKQLLDHVTRNHRQEKIESLAGAVYRFLDAVRPFPGTKLSTSRLAA
jgi:transposase